MAPDLASRGLLHPEDAHSLAAYCEAVCEFRAAVLWLSEHSDGWYIELPSGVVIPHPALVRRDKSADRVRRFGALFGLNPADRVRVSPGADRAVEESGLDAILRRRPLGA